MDCDETCRMCLLVAKIFIMAQTPLFDEIYHLLYFLRKIMPGGGVLGIKEAVLVVERGSPEWLQWR